MHRTTPFEALVLLLNSVTLTSWLTLPSANKDEMKRIASRLRAQPVHRASALVAVLFDLWRATEPRIDQLYHQIAHHRSGEEEDPSALEQLWDAVKADLGFVALIVLFLRNQPDIDPVEILREYQDHPIYPELAALFSTGVSN